MEEYLLLIFYNNSLEQIQQQFDPLISNNLPFCALSCQHSNQQYISLISSLQIYNLPQQKYLQSHTIRSSNSQDNHTIFLFFSTCLKYFLFFFIYYTNILSLFSTSPFNVTLIELYFQLSLSIIQHRKVLNFYSTNTEKDHSPLAAKYLLTYRYSNPLLLYIILHYRRLLSRVRIFVRYSGTFYYHFMNNSGSISRGSSFSGGYELQQVRQQLNPPILVTSYFVRKGQIKSQIA